MNIKTHKAISAGLNLIVTVGAFEALVTILNLNQPALYIRTAFYVGIFYILQIVILYDLHLKTPGSFKRAQKKHESVQRAVVKAFKILGSALWDRCAHLREWKFFTQWLNYLILPGIIFWSTIAILFVNFGYLKIQQIFVAISSLALLLNYWYLKEIFIRAKAEVDEDVFISLSMLKIYASALMYGAGLAIIKHYCLEANLLVLGIFALTFLLLYQALFQHNLVTVKNLALSLFISLVMGALGYLVLVFWGYNYFTAAVFLGACYNLMWGIFHYSLDKSLTWHAFWEIIIISALIGSMLFGVTNFKAQLLDGCNYRVEVR